MAFFIQTGFLSPLQHGFVPRRSCLSNLLITEERVTRIIDSGETADMVFLDFAKAFDSVNHRKLLAKLISAGVHPELVSWIGAFLKNRTFQVRVKDQLSTPGQATSGVPKGSVLGPILFSYLHQRLGCNTR